MDSIYVNHCWIDAAGGGDRDDLEEGATMRPTKANLECADVILERNNLPPHAWPDLRRDIALAMDIAEREAVKKARKKSS